MLKDLLPVFDNLERAVQHAEAAPDAQAVAAGLRMVLKQFADTLEKAGIKRIATVGLPFDPTRHEAIQQVDVRRAPAGVVVAEVQPGYTMGDTLVRAALVVVSNGAPSASEPRPESELVWDAGVPPVGGARPLRAGGTLAVASTPSCERRRATPLRGAQT